MFPEFLKQQETPAYSENAEDFRKSNDSIAAKQLKFRSSHSIQIGRSWNLHQHFQRFETDAVVLSCNLADSIFLNKIPQVCAGI